MTGKFTDLATSVRLVILGVVIFSVAYSGSIGLVGQTIWNEKATGSLIQSDGETVGSELIGQDFDESTYFHGRPSSIEYDAMRSGSQNLAPNNPIVGERVRDDLTGLTESNYRDGAYIEVPAVLLTESGSGLDPHITVESALFQIPRIANETGISERRLRSVVREHTEEKLLGVFGTRKVNVLRLNIALLRILAE